MDRPRHTIHIERKTMLRVAWDQRGVVDYEPLKYRETVNTKRYQQQLTDLNRFLRERRPESGRTERGNTKSYFFITYRKTGLRHVGIIQLGSSTPCGLLTRFGFFWLPLVCIDGSPTCWAALWFVRRCEKIARWMFRGKRGRILLAWYSQIARKMGKCITSYGAFFE